MVAEYIEREAALKCICSGCFEGNMEENAFCGIPCDDYKRISKIPAADVRPVVRGKWREEMVVGGFAESWESTCSICGKRYMDIGKPHFCPNCGAMMEES